MAMQMPRTLVGNISAQRMFGIGPNPMAKKQLYKMTLTVDTAALAMLPTCTTLTITRMIRDAVSTGFVLSSKLLQKER